MSTPAQLTRITQDVSPTHRGVYTMTEQQKPYAVTCRVTVWVDAANEDEAEAKATATIQERDDFYLDEIEATDQWDEEK